MWLVGTMFSYGKNDTPAELVYCLVTFLFDLPVFFYLGLRRRSPQIFPFCVLLALLLTGLLLGAPRGVINYYTIPLWYLPKIVPLALAFWRPNPVAEVQRH